MQEDFAIEFYVDNKFYVKEVISMDKKHFKKDTLIGSDIERIYFYKKGTDFYRDK